MNFLREIIEHKRTQLAMDYEVRPLAKVRASAEKCRAKAERQSLRNALTRRDGPNIIAEFKRASPSKGVIRAGADPGGIASDYEANGAIAISVLTEESMFMGSLADLRDVRSAVQLPILRKDFIIDEYQIYEAAASGADAILLITAALDDITLGRLRSVTEEELALDAIVEVHTKEELRRALACGAGLIGVNNRDLRTFEVSIETSIELARHLPREAVAITESGLRTADDIRRLHSAGYRGFLIGESLMRETFPGQALGQLIADARNHQPALRGI